MWINCTGWLKCVRWKIYLLRCGCPCSSLAYRLCFITYQGIITKSFCASFVLVFRYLLGSEVVCACARQTWLAQIWWCPLYCGVLMSPHIVFRVCFCRAIWKHWPRAAMMVRYVYGKYIKPLGIWINRMMFCVCLCPQESRSRHVENDATVSTGRPHRTSIVFVACIHHPGQ